MSCTLGEIVQALGGALHGDASLVVHRIATLSSAQSGEITFLSHEKYSAHLKGSQATCIILTSQAAQAFLGGHSAVRAWIEAPDPYLYFAKLTQWWAARAGRLARAGIAASAIVHPSAQIDASASIGELCVIGPDVRIGSQTRLAAHVTVAAGCQIGQRCVLHSGVVIGADGFGFAVRADGAWEKIEQLGAVRIGDDVEVGANTCIDRGTLEDTVIGDGVKLDNLIQIGHNVQIGAHTALAGNAGVAGSAKIGAYCTIGGGAVILGHLSIADHVHISACTTVTRSIHTPDTYTGVFPLDKNEAWEKNAVTLRQLHRLRDRVRELERAVADLTGEQPTHS